MFQVALAFGSLAVMATGSAIVGDGNVILGVANAGHLNVPYNGDILGLPSYDPKGIQYIGMRDPSGRITSLEQGCLCEGWGVGIRRANGSFDDECGADADALTDIMFDSFNGTDGDSQASSAVICGAQRKLWVEHKFHPGPCSGLYEVQVTIGNLGCEDIHSDIIYRRAMDWDIDPSPFLELVTIKGSGSPFFDNASNNGFCSSYPSAPCATFYTSVPPDFTDKGPKDHGAQVDLKLGGLRSRERMTFKTFYGYFPTEADAQRCMDTNGYELYTFGQDSQQQNTFVWAFKPSVKRYFALSDPATLKLALKGEKPESSFPFQSRLKLPAKPPKNDCVPATSVTRKLRSVPAEPTDGSVKDTDPELIEWEKEEVKRSQQVL
jgi:hypothetical protein